MKLKLGWGPSAFAVSVVALILSLGGTGYAITTASSSSGHASGPSAATARPAWHTLTLTNGWRHGGYGSYTASFYKDSEGIVHLRGSAAHGTYDDVAFTLPRADRPSHTLWLSIYAYDGSSGGLEIKSNGQAYLFDPDSGADVTAYASLDGVSFPVP
jgi:hypothetical protein